MNRFYVESVSQIMIRIEVGENVALSFVHNQPSVVLIPTKIAPQFHISINFQLDKIVVLVKIYLI